VFQFFLFIIAFVLVLIDSFLVWNRETKAPKKSEPRRRKRKKRKERVGRMEELILV